MYMNILPGTSSTTEVIICGKKGGLPFQNVTRAINTNGDCPEYYEACAPNSAADNTICYPTSALESSCPITDILVIETSAAQTFENKGYSTVALNDTASIAFSKTVDSLPPTSIKLESSMPCISPYD